MYLESAGGHFREVEHLVDKVPEMIR